jgi:arginine N-succinyltransferase
MFLVREAHLEDLDGLFELSKTANFLNLPRDRKELEAKIRRSQKSFRSDAKNPSVHEYFFVLEDLKAEQIIGTSQILGQHGTPTEPHVYFSVINKKKRSKTVQKTFTHEVLRLGFDHDGPTEIGGLVLMPKYRGHDERLGKFLSFSRFLYMAARRPLFCDDVLSELLPPFNEDGSSPIWEEIGRKFTNMRYQEADKLSRKNNEFIISLFPEGDIYTCLLTKEAREAIGQVGAETIPVQKMLEKIGFRYSHMIDPFDGGPHYWAKTSAITPVKQTRRVRLARSKGKALKQSRGLLLAIEKKSPRLIQTEVTFKNKH